MSRSDGKKQAKPTSGLSRRAVIQRGGLAAAATLATPLLLPSRTSAAEPLRILCWPGYEEKDVIGEFEDTHKIQVQFKTYIGGEQMLQFFGQSPPGTFDAIISDAEYVQKLVASNAIESFKKADFPELANYHPRYADFVPMRAGEGMIYGVATRFSFYGISYNRKYMSDEQAEDWNSLFDPKLKGKIGMFDWYLPNMGNASLAVMPRNEKPYDVGSDHLAKVRAWLLKLRPQISVFASSSQPLVQAMISGDIYASPTGDLDVDLKLAGYDNFSSTIPKQGGIRWQEVATLCRAGRKKDVALQWIKYMSTAKAQSKLVYTKAFKARGPNMKIVEHWNDDQKKLLSYVPDPANPGKMLVETLIDRSIARGLPAQQPEKEWIAIFNEFKTS